MVKRKRFSSLYDTEEALDEKHRLEMKGFEVNVKFEPETHNWIILEWEEKENDRKESVLEI